MSTAPFAALFLTLMAVGAGLPHSATGFAVTIAKLEPCRGHYDNRTIFVRVLSHEDIQINGIGVNREALERRLGEIFKTRVYRYIFLMGDPGVPFGDVAQVIGAALKQVDVSIITPSILEKAKWASSFCLSERTPENYFAHPLLH